MIYSNNILDKPHPKTNSMQAKLEEGGILHCSLVVAVPVTATVSADQFADQLPPPHTTAVHQPSPRILMHHVLNQITFDLFKQFDRRMRDPHKANGREEITQQVPTAIAIAPIQSPSIQSSIQQSLAYDRSIESASVQLPRTTSSSAADTK